ALNFSSLPEENLIDIPVASVTILSTRTFSASHCLEYQSAATYHSIVIGLLSSPCCPSVAVEPGELVVLGLLLLEHAYNIVDSNEVTNKTVTSLKLLTIN